MTALDKSTDSLPPFQFSTFASLTEELIGGYSGNRMMLSPTGKWVAQIMESSSAKAKAAEKERRTIIHELWSNRVWRADLEAETYVNSLKSNYSSYKPGFQMSDYTTQPFRNAIHYMLVEMAKSPREKQFLQVLVKELRAKQESVVFSEAPPVDLLAAALLGNLIPQGSCVEKYQKSSRFTHVSICLVERCLFLFQDATGALHLSPMPTRRALAHELIHVYQFVSGKAEQLKAHKHSSYCWSNALEMMTIRGYGKNLGVESFSENSFARARGEMERVSHAMFPGLEMTTHQIFKIAFCAGFSGTVSVQLNQTFVSLTAREVWTAEATKAAKELALSRRLPTSSSQTQSQWESFFLEHLLKPFKEAEAQLKLLDLNLYSDTEIVNGYFNGIDSAFKFTDDPEDRALKEKMLKGREEALTQLLGFFCATGQEKRADNIRALVDARLKERAKLYEKLREDLKPVGAMLAQAKKMIELANADK